MLTLYKYTNFSALISQKKKKKAFLASLLRMCFTKTLLVLYAERNKAIKALLKATLI